ncbi:tyrosine-type recombinase/integrase [Rhodococcus sp. IEGM 1307]|uniref:tyrosine-type recombinase/integrase n=1 Tax=Rhodococcus sp. IEGM 1307 TaxID=3047091 RepID=UPI0024B78072|nr:tyrosine-type recombinase/integrase [Rhodococcus sp. IEGM 1307]MDI9979822.1 tyrosine-type recombinase/integrase [Rhodococcus sp. IEGM 1307]
MDGDGRFTVRKVPHSDGTHSSWIFTPDAEVDRASLNVLAAYGTSSQRTYAYALADHLNWANANGKSPGSITLKDLLRYMNGLIGGEAGIHGAVWRRPEQQPTVAASAAATTATIVKAYYLRLSVTQSIDPALVEALTRPGRSRRVREANPLAPTKGTRRPRFLPDEVVETLYRPGNLTTARDIMIVTWLHDGGLRVGGLCGLRFADLHLIRHHPCGQRAEPHVHIVGRDDNPNGARAKSYTDHRAANMSKDGYVVDGGIRAVSPDMISTFYAYLLDEYHPLQHAVDHQQVLIHVRGTTPGAALSTSGVRKMLRRACARADLPVRITPHAFRHKAASALYAASDFNAEMVAQEFGWAAPEMVINLYGRSANRDAVRYLQQAWDATARPPTEPHLVPAEAAE